MKILAIETSCDETAVSIIDSKGTINAPDFQIISSVVLSQLKVHAEWGGVVPNIAKREHEKALVPITIEALKKASLLQESPTEISLPTAELETLLAKEKILNADIAAKFERILPPKIDAIAVTAGPGLEPALWVGINFAKALGIIWSLPIIPVNHMAGHFYAALIEESGKWRGLEFPAIGLLISGGHSEIVYSEKIGDFKIIGKTRDDAVGEAFDKVARLLGLPYPGGPSISAQAKLANEKSRFKLPRPMFHSGDYDFSFSGLKTATLYLTRELEKTNPDWKNDPAIISEIAYEFETAAIDVLIHKTIHAARELGTRSIVVGGGVSANKKLHTRLDDAVKKELPDVTLLFPAPALSTDNATMIALAATFHPEPSSNIVANGNLSF